MKVVTVKFLAQGLFLKVLAKAIRCASAGTVVVLSIKHLDPSVLTHTVRT